MIDACQAVPLLRMAATGVVDQDLAHGMGGNPQEVLAILHAQVSCGNRSLSVAAR
jgi:hypothetical protein